jgi:hypothetical protein
LIGIFTVFSHPPFYLADAGAKQKWRLKATFQALAYMRTGLERATSYHNHDGFQASPRQNLQVPSFLLIQGN